ncbi:hypothetical protein JCM13664_13520 [Methylothermus subterraneus]
MREVALCLQSDKRAGIILKWRESPDEQFMAGHVGPLAALGRQPRQAREGATVTVDACAGVRLAWPAALKR